MIAHIVITVIILVVISSIGIPILVDNIEGQEKALAKLSLEQLHSTVLTTIRSNFTALNNYMSITSNSLSELYELDASLDRFQDIALLPQLIANFDVLRITYFNIITDPLELETHITKGKMLYNTTAFEPYDLLPNGSITYIKRGEETYPLLLLLIASPYNSSPGLPRVGTFNAISVGGQEAILSAQFNNTEYYISSVTQQIRVDGSVNKLIFFG